MVHQVQGDVRLITSAAYSTGYSLRFPRVTRIRYDKSCHDVMTVDELKRIVEENKGMVTGPTGDSSSAPSVLAPLWWSFPATPQPLSV